MSDDHKVHITEIAGIPYDEYVSFTIRGRMKGKQAKPTECYFCHEEISIGEQYFRIDDYMHVCLACAKYE